MRREPARTYQRTVQVNRTPTIDKTVARKPLRNPAQVLILSTRMTIPACCGEYKAVKQWLQLGISLSALAGRDVIEIMEIRAN